MKFANRGNREVLLTMFPPVFLPYPLSLIPYPLSLMLDGQNVGDDNLSGLQHIVLEDCKSKLIKGFVQMTQYILARLSDS